MQRLQTELRDTAAPPCQNSSVYWSNGWSCGWILSAKHTCSWPATGRRYKLVKMSIKAKRRLPKSLPYPSSAPAHTELSVRRYNASPTARTDEPCVYVGCWRLQQVKHKNIQKQGVACSIRSDVVMLCCCFVPHLQCVFMCEAPFLYH